MSKYTPEQEKEMVNNALRDLLTLLEREVLEHNKSFADYFVELVEKNDTEKLKEVALVFAKGVKQDADLHEITSAVVANGRLSLRNALAMADWELKSQINERYYDTYLAHLG